MLQDTKINILYAKGPIHQKYLTIINVYAPKKHTKQTNKIKGEMDNSTISVGEFNTCFSGSDKLY